MGPKKRSAPQSKPSSAKRSRPDTADNDDVEVSSALSAFKAIKPIDSNCTNNVTQTAKLPKSAPAVNGKTKLDMEQVHNGFATRLHEFGSKNTIVGPCEWSGCRDDVLLLRPKGNTIPVRTDGKLRIASFDMDFTLIETKSGKTFAQSADDWRLLWSTCIDKRKTAVVDKVKELNDSGHSIVIISNQAGIEKGKVIVDAFQKKVSNIVSALAVPVWGVFCINSDSVFRKPAPGMWYQSLSLLGDADVARHPSKHVDFASSFYCGDAAGRPDRWAPGVKKDFAASDMLFARNVRTDDVGGELRFHTPEELLLSAKLFERSKCMVPLFDPSQYLNVARLSVDNVKSMLCSPAMGGNVEVVVLVGYPASGKSTLAKEYLVPAGYEHVNRDTLKTWQKCVAATESALKQGKSVVVDNTNADVDSRKRYVDAAKKFKVPVRCVVVDASMEQAEHNERFRRMTKRAHEAVPAMVLRMFRKNYRPPTSAEGFVRVDTLAANQLPVQLNSDFEKFLFSCKLVEK